MTDRVWRGLVFIALVGTPLSILRCMVTGWLPLYTVHIVLAAIVLVAYALGARLPLVVRSALIVALFWGVGLAGLFMLGLLSAGVWWLATASFLVGFVYSVRAGLVTTAAAVVVVAVAGWGFVSGGLHVQIDANQYAHSVTPWLTLLVAVAIMPTVVFLSLADLQRTTIDLVTEIEQQREQIHHMAMHDELTGLPTMRLARDRLEHALLNLHRSRAKVGLVFLDLDGFKAVNDHYGHDAGDAVLKEVAARIVAALREGDTVARKSGDEFIAILERVADVEAASAVARRVLAAIATPIPYGDLVLHIGASAGVALSPDHSRGVEDLIRAADAAMYAAKRSGRSRIAVAALLPARQAAFEAGHPAST